MGDLAKHQIISLRKHKTIGSSQVHLSALNQPKDMEFDEFVDKHRKRMLFLENLEIKRLE